MEPENELVKPSTRTLESELHSPDAFHVEVSGAQRKDLSEHFAEMKRFVEVRNLDHEKLVQYAAFRNEPDLERVIDNLANDNQERMLAFSWLHQNQEPGHERSFEDTNIIRATRSIWETTDRSFTPGELLRLTDRVHEHGGVFLVHEDEPINVKQAISARDKLENCLSGIPKAQRESIREELAYNAGAAAASLINELHVVERENPFEALTIDKDVIKDHGEAVVRGFHRQTLSEYEGHARPYPGSDKDREKRAEIEELVQNFRSCVERGFELNGDRPFVNRVEHALSEARIESAEHGLSLDQS